MEESSSRNEVWVSLDFLGYPNYQVSNQGRVKGPRKIREGTPMGQGGYLVVDLYHNGSKRQNWLIHRLVALAFVDNPDPDNFDEVNHKDTNKRNNAADNLEWTNSSGNRKHSYALGRNKSGEQHGNAKLDTETVHWIRDNYKSRDPQFGQSALARQLGVSQYAIWAIVNGVWRRNG